MDGLTLVAVVASALSVGLLWYGVYEPVSDWLLTTSGRDARRYLTWSQQLFLNWQTEDVTRRALQHRVAIFVSGALVWLVSNPVFAVSTALLVYVAPTLIYRAVRQRRREALERQLPDAASIMVAAVRSGQALPVAIEEVARKMARPASDEFGLIASEHFVGGMSIEEALDRARHRIDAETFDMIASALIINSRQGGDLLGILERIAAATRALHRLQVKLVTETSEVRAQQKLIIFATPAFGLLAFMFDSSVANMLLHTWTGNFLLVFVLVVQAMCIFWIRRIIKTTI